MSGTLTVNGVTTSINKGYLLPNYTGMDPMFDSRRFYIILSDGDVSFVDNEYVYADNIHQMIDFNLYTSSNNSGSVENTTYTLWNTTGFDWDTAFIDHSGISTNVIMQNGHPDSMDHLSSDDMDNGQCTISENNGVYTLTFSFSDGQNTINGNFVGTLTHFNYQD